MRDHAHRDRRYVLYRPWWVRVLDWLASVPWWDLDPGLPPSQTVTPPKVAAQRDGLLKSSTQRGGRGGMTEDKP